MKCGKTAGSPATLPGDFRIEGERYKIYFPLATMILVSIIGTILLNIIARVFRR